MTFFSPCLFGDFRFTLSQHLLTGNTEHLFFSGPDSFFPFARSAAKTASSKKLLFKLRYNMQTTGHKPYNATSTAPPFPPRLGPRHTGFP